MRSPLLAALCLSLLVPTSRSPAGEGKETSFTGVAREMRHSVFLVGGPKIGTGTGWVLSQRHRLLATNAHVADLFFDAQTKGVECRAMQNETGVTWKIERVWYHPGVRRFPQTDQSLSVASTDRKVGKVNPACPDVAVVQLADGPAMPAEWSMAAPGAIFDLQFEKAAMLGFPGHDTRWPAEGKKALATFHTGDISRVSDFKLDGGVPKEQAQMLQYTIDSARGFSGSPVFLANGKVIALNHMGRKPAGEDRMIAHGVRVDALWELLAHHGLDDKVRVPMPRERLLIARWLAADPAWDLHRKLRAMMDDASFLTFTKQDYPAAVGKCDEILKVLPTYTEANELRANALIGWYFNHGESWNKDKRLLVLELAAEDAKRRLERMDEPDVYIELQHAAINNNLGNVTGDRKHNKLALKIAESVLARDGVSKHHRGFATSIKAIAHNNLGNNKEAANFHEQALMIDPDSASNWDGRAAFWRARGNPDLARYDQDKADELRKKNLLLKKSAWKQLKKVFEINGTLRADDPKDAKGKHFKHIEVDLEEAFYYQFDLRNPDFLNLGARHFDPFLEFLGKEVWGDDDGGGRPHARLFFTAGRTGAHRFRITSYEPGDTGNFVFSVLRIAENR